MSGGLFLGVSLIWTGLLAGAAELLSRGTVQPNFARAVWRGAAGLMALPWFAAGAALIWPNAVADLPIPDMPEIVVGDGVGPKLGLDAIGAPEISVSLTTILLAILAIGWAIRFICAVRGQVRLQRLKAEAVPTSVQQLSAISRECAEKLSMQRVPEVFAIPSLTSPFAAGVRTRKIFLPLHIVGSGHEPMIIAHESVHIASMDLITRPFERLVADIIWFSPFAWLARRRLDYLREAVCDAETIELTGAPKAYARALVDVARGQPTFEALPVAAFILKDRSSLKRRVTSLLGEQGPSRKRLGMVALLGALLAVPLALAQGISSANAAVSTQYTHAVIHSSKAYVSSKWGACVECSKEKKNYFHKGVDVAAPTGTPIYSPANGAVKHCGTKDGYGNVVDLLLDDGTKLRFAQLKKSKVKTGDIISAGDLVGLVGQSGTTATGPHLHLEVWRKDESGEVISHDPEAEGIQLTN